jgi:hypothetical protein
MRIYACPFCGRPGRLTPEEELMGEPCQECPAAEIHRKQNTHD